MEKQTWYLIWIPIMFMLLSVYCGIVTIDDLEMTGDLIDKRIDNGEMKFVIRNETTTIIDVDANLYYSKEIGDIVTIEYEDTDMIHTYSVYSTVFLIMFLVSGFVVGYLNSIFWNTNYDREHSRGGS